LIELAIICKVQHLVLIDINNCTGFFDLLKLANAAGIKATPGMEIRNGNDCLYFLIAKNNTGFQEINRFVSECLIRQEDFPEQAPRLDEVVAIYPTERHALARKDAFIALAPHALNKMMGNALKNKFEKLFYFPLLTLEEPNDLLLHHHLRCIQNNCLLSMMPQTGNANTEENPAFLLSAEKRIQTDEKYFLNYLHTLSSLSFDFIFRSNKNKAVFSGSGTEDKQQLESLCLQGLEKRYGKRNKDALKRLYHELDIIEKLNFNAYFLITHDIVSFAKHRNFYHVGRGSGANSIAAYCLGITDVDPIELDLYFERFLNPKRSSPPDFDIDFSWKERDEVLHYIFDKYTYRYAALLGTISTFKDSSPIRELGKVAGLPKQEIDTLADNPRQEPGNLLSQQVLKLSSRLQSFPNHLSIHAGGVLISEEPIYAYSATHMPPKGFPTVQWDMYIAEDIGFEKFDILSQRGIGHIKEAAQIIKENCGLDVDVHRIAEFKQDEAIKKQLRSADTIGCFYIESPAMRGLLQKLHCSDYLTLVAASSIIRPGVSSSGMMQAYIERHNRPDSFSYLHPVMKEQLSETYGIMVYQEDVLKVCHHFAGLDLADADVLRRAMSGKYRSKTEFLKITEKFFANCRAKGYSDSLAAEVWRQIESFAGYSFSKAHSASFAAESFQSLYLKTYFPREFMVAVINNFGGFYRTWVYITEAAKAGAEITLPCVNYSRLHTSMKSKKIWLGFIHIESLRHSLIEKLLKSRERLGPFVSLEDFIDRTGAGAEQMQILIRTGALRFTGSSKESLLWQTYTYINRRGHAQVHDKLFPVSTKKYSLPEFERNLLCDAYDEIELLGFSISMDDFDLLRTPVREPLKATNLKQLLGQEVRIMGLLVTWKPVRTSKGENMCFGTFYDMEKNFFDTVHFPPVFREYPLSGKGVYLIKGKVSESFGQFTIEVSRIAKLPLKPDPRNG
jgi:DNA polymerase-3 subunit alpha